jgi:hypothetical protein
MIGEVPLFKGIVDSIAMRGGSAVGDSFQESSFDKLLVFNL